MEALANLYFVQPFWLWAGLGATLLAIEVMSGSGWLLWAAASAVATGAATALAHITFPSALLIFAVLTIASTLLARRYLPRSVPAAGGDINDSVGRLVGHHGVSVSAFTGPSGRVFVDGKEWAAELDESEGEGLEAGARVEVVAVSGASLKVRQP